MNKKMVWLAGALALAIPCVASAAPMSATRSADLMTPIPNAVETPVASDAMLRDTDGAKLETVGFFFHRHHGYYHRHFWHHRFYGRHRFFHRRFFHRHRYFY